MQEQSIQVIDERTIKINLLSGVKRGDAVVKSFTLRAPVGADFEGLSQELINLKHTDQIQKLIQRISSPQLVRREYMQLPMDDLRALNVAIDFFSAPPATKAQMLEDLQAAGFAVEPASASVIQPE